MIDTHAHIHVKDYDADRSAVIERARSAGVSKIINVGFDAEGNWEALALAKQYDFIWCTMGIHPHLANEWNDYVEGTIEDAIKKEDRIVGIGEAGLDYFKNFQSKELQKEVFKRQIRLAKKHDLPIIIHCREAFDDCLFLLKEGGSQKALFHCFTGVAEDAKKILDGGFYIAFTGIITYPSATAIREAAKITPMDRIFTETDCPYLAPQKYRGTRNEPAYVTEVLKKVAEIKDIPPEKAEQQIEINLNALFGI